MTQNKAEKIELIDIDLLIENPKNNNHHSQEQLQRLAKIITATGFRTPLVVSKRSGFVLCGHGRIAAAKIAGMKELPVIFQDFKDEAEEYAHMTSDNTIARWSEIDFSMINAELPNLGPDFDIDSLGIKDFVLEPMEKFSIESDDDEFTEEGSTSLSDELNKMFVLQVTLPNDMELADIRDELLSRGYIVKQLGLPKPTRNYQMPPPPRRKSMKSISSLSEE